MLVFSPELLKAVADEFLKPLPDDAIIECYKGGWQNLRTEAATLLARANKELHTFPFRDVKACWFRLYTDASIAKVLNMIEHPFLLDELDSMVSLLDMALIMAGGLCRERMIHDILSGLQAALRKDEEETKRPAKRRRLEKDTPNQCSSDALPQDNISIPKLQFPIRHISQPSLTQFQHHMQDSREPVVLADVLTHWHALEKWKHQSYWMSRTMHGRRLVPVEVGRSYTDEDWGQSIIPFREFLEKFILHQPGAANEQETLNRTGYLAQHDLLKQIPLLRNDIAIPDYCYLDAPPPEPGTPVALAKSRKGGFKTASHPSTVPSVTLTSPELGDAGGEGTSDDGEVQQNIWFGPAWTISPLHHDPYHNILCQVVGKKYVRLYSPIHSESLLPRRSDEPAPHIINVEDDGKATASSDGTKRSPDTIDMSNTSQIDVAAMELSPMEDWDKVYPGIGEIPYLECILEAGQALYIPVGWWHYVRSCSVGISVSFWW